MEVLEPKLINIIDVIDAHVGAESEIASQLKLYTMMMVSAITLGSDCFGTD